MTDEKEWRRFMDQKWAEYYRDRDLFNKRYSSDALRPTPNLLSEVANKKKDAQPAQKKSQAPRSTNQKPMAKAQRPMKAPAPVARSVQQEFNIPAAGARRRELGKKLNPTDAELREYRDLSNKIEDELDKRQRKINSDASKA